MGKFLKFIWKTILTVFLLFTILGLIGMCSDKNSNDGNEEEHRHFYSLSRIIEEATCTENGKGEYTCTCGETKEDVIAAEHNTYKGVCQRCKKGVIDIKLPDTPVFVEGLYKVTEIEITEISEPGSYSSSYTVYISLSGECVKNSWYGVNAIKYKLYDSEGYVVESGIISIPDVTAGEKFKGAKFYIYSDQLKENDTYTLVFENQTN